MKDILIESDYSKSSRPAIFSKLAFGFSIFTFVLFTIFFVNIILIMRASGGNPVISKFITGLLLFSMVLGLCFSIVSMVKKEKLKYIKVIAAVINIGLFLIILGSMVFALIVDLKK